MEELNTTQTAATESTMNVDAETQTTPASIEHENTPSAEQSGDMNTPLEPSADTAAENSEQEPDADYSGMDREQLIDTLEMLMREEVHRIKHRVTKLRIRFEELTKEIHEANYQAFIAGGGLEENFMPEEDSLAQRFQTLINAYRERRKLHLEAVENNKRQNLAAKQQLLDELRQLIDTENESLKHTYDKFKEIQERWKEIGDVPRESLNDLWQSYHFLVEQFFGKVKMNKELRDLDMKRNLEQKIELCEKAEELIIEPSVDTAFKSMQALRAQWREIGPVPAEYNDEIWQRFCNAVNQVDQRRKEYYEQRHQQLEQNLLAKQELLKKTEELLTEKPTSVKQWNEQSATLDEFLRTWKSIGPVPHESSDTIWQQFKGRIDEFYAEKKSYFNQMRTLQDENYNRKIELCLKAEAIAERNDWKQATDELLKLQEEWKQIGMVRRKQSEKLWQRFRGACDSFFARKNEHFKEQRTSEKENLHKKEAIIAELKEYRFGDDKDENLRVIKEFQRRWIEAGFVPAKDKNRIQSEFRSIMDGLFENLKISMRAAEEDAYREKIGNALVNGSPLKGERQNLIERIEKLRGDINLWENNLGFFANSKQADLLRQEFEKKMQDARQKLALLQAKLKILDQAEKGK